MIQSYLKTGMVFYDDQNKQHFRRDCCKETFIQYTDNEHFPAFQIFLEDEIDFATDPVFELYDLEDNLIGAFTNINFDRDETYLHDGIYTYIHNFLTNSLGVDTNLIYPAGHDFVTNYYIKVTFTLTDTSIVSYYSEAFRICNVCVTGDTLRDYILLANGINGLDVYRIHEDGFLHIDNDNQGGEAQNTWKDDNFIYLANGTNGLETYSIDANGVLTHIDNDDQGGAANGVYGDGDFIYVANDINGIEVYSVDVTGHLTHVDNDDQGGTAEDVWCDGNFIYLANGARGIEVYSVDGAGTLTHEDNDFIAGTGEGVWGDGDFIYLANGTNGLEVYTVDGAGALTHVDNDDQGGVAYAVWGDGTYIYLANDTRGIESYTVDGAGTLTHVDDLVTDGRNVWSDGTYVYLANGNRGVESYSVSALGVLTHIDHYARGDTAYDVWGDGTFLYVANGTTGLQVFSVAGGVFVLLSTYDIGGTAYGVFGNGTYIYLANGARGLEVFTVNEAGILTHRDNDDQGGTAYAVWAAGANVFLANGLNGIESYIISGGVLTHEDNVALAPNPVYDIHGYAADPKIYVANGVNGAVWYDYITATGILNYRGVYNTPGTEARGIFAESTGTFVYVGFDTSGLYLLTWNLLNRDSDDQGGNAYGVWNDGTYTYLANRSRGIETYTEAADALTHRDNDQQVENALSVFGRDGYIYLADGTNGIKAYENESGDFYYMDDDFIAGTGEGVFVADVLVRDCDVGHILLSWWADCDWDDIIYQFGFRNYLYLDAVLNNPSEEIEINQNDRLGEMLPSDVIIKKKYKLAERIPEYLWNALIRLPAYGSEMPNFHAWITLPDGSSCSMSEVNISGEWDTVNCMNTFTIEFVDNDEYPVVATNCCDDEDVSEVYFEDVSESI